MVTSWCRRTGCASFCSMWYEDRWKGASVFAEPAGGEVTSEEESVWNVSHTRCTAGNDGGRLATFAKKDTSPCPCGSRSSEEPISSGRIPTGRCFVSSGFVFYKFDFSRIGIPVRICLQEVYFIYLLRVLPIREEFVVLENEILQFSLSLNEDGDSFYTDRDVEFTAVMILGGFQVGVQVGFFMHFTNMF